MERIVLKRRGRADLAFDGCLVARVADSPQAAVAKGIELALYRTGSGKFILASAVGPRDALGNQGLCKALVFSSADDVRWFVMSECGRDFTAVGQSLLRRAAMQDMAFQEDDRLAVPA